MPPEQDVSARQKALALLGLRPGAGAGEVRRAYRRLALQCHPDLHPGSPSLALRFQELSEACRLLLGAGTGEPLAAAPQGLPARGRDLHYRLRLDFLQAARGGEFPVRFTRMRPCPACAGAGCGDCKGRGEVVERAMARVRVPSGIEEGETLRAAGEGEPGRSGGPAGDLMILVSCGGHPALRRQGLDVYGEVSLPSFRLAEGGPVRVPTVRGAMRIQIPPATRPGSVFKLAGCGIERMQPGGPLRGDHVVRVLEMPAEALDYAEKTSPRYPWKARRGEG